MPSQEDAVAQVRAAFATLSPPTTVTTHDCEECAEIQVAFANRPWDSLPASIIESHTALALFEPGAFVYYLPAYLLYALAQPTSDVAMYLMIAIAPHEPNRFSECRFNEEQRQAILATAESVADQTGDHILEIRDIRRLWSG
jgi:hypothetical protein